MMKIIEVQWSIYQIPLKTGFATAHGILHTRQGALVEITTDTDIIGVGEIAPMPEFGGGTLDTALASLSMLATQIQGKDLTEGLEILQQQAHTLPSSTCCALEVALLDALGKAKQCSVRDLLSNPQTEPLPHLSARTHIRVNAVVGASTTIAVAEAARQATAAGFSCVKLKVGNGGIADIERVAAVRDAIGPATHLRLDANEAWDFEQASTILTQLSNFSIQYIEQPLKAEDLDGMRRLRQVVSIPIAADEAIHNLESARLVLAAQAADVLIIKPQLAGGLRMAQSIIQEATKYAVQSVITSTIETGIGLVGAIHLAAATPEITLECGLATLHLLEDDLLLDDLSLHDGFLAVPPGYGLGICLDRQALEKYGKRG